MKEHARMIITNDVLWVLQIADLSCGNGAVVRDAAEYARSLYRQRTQFDLTRVIEYLGDIAPGYAYVGPIEETLGQVPSVDLFVNGETLEHLDDPDLVLRSIACKTRWLVLSTPTQNWNDTNAEHLWAWSEDDVTAMLTEAGFTIDRVSVVDSREWNEPYRYGIWTACATAER
jgi:hypothetical protein